MGLVHRNVNIPFCDGLMDIVKEVFKLPEGIVPFSLIALGYPDEAKNSEKRFKPERIHKQTW